MRTLTRTYPTYQQALRRVELLKKRDGIWPGITGPHPTGTYTLTYDPEYENETTP